MQPMQQKTLFSKFHYRKMCRMQSTVLSSPLSSRNAFVHKGTRMAGISKDESQEEVGNRCDQIESQLSRHVIVRLIAQWDSWNNKSNDSPDMDARIESCATKVSCRKRKLEETAPSLGDTYMGRSCSSPRIVRKLDEVYFAHETYDSARGHLQMYAS